MDEAILKNAQYRKGLSIAFFNATNSAISLCAGMNPNTETLSKVIELRDFFLEEHKNYYAKVIANVGLNFNPEATIKRLNEAKNKEGLRDIWLSLSEDERANEEIIKAKDELKEKYEKA